MPLKGWGGGGGWAGSHQKTDELGDEDDLEKIFLSLKHAVC